VRGGDVFFKISGGWRKKFQKQIDPSQKKICYGDHLWAKGICITFLKVLGISPSGGY